MSKEVLCQFFLFSFRIVQDYLFGCFIYYLAEIALQIYFFSSIFLILRHTKKSKEVGSAISNGGSNCCVPALSPLTSIAEVSSRREK